MQLHKTLAITLLSLLLLACGGSLDGTSTTDSTDTKDTTDSTDDTAVVDDAAPAEAGVPSYFTYTGASQSWIAIQGTGGEGRTEASVLTFKLSDLNGDAVPGVDVDFALTGPSGTTIDPLTGTTNDSGFVSTTVRSGTVSGPVRVNVILADGSDITTVSSSLSVSTGLPDQNSISISAANWAPEGLDIEGVTSAVTIRLADKYNNAVPDGTVIYFTTEGGAIRDETTGTVGTCLTTASKCSLIWESQNPRPHGNMLSDFNSLGECGYWKFGPEAFGPCINPGGMGQPYGGRSTITAYTLGEEIFVDNDGDGWFTLGDDFFAKNDLAEVFYDNNEDGYYKENPSAINIGDEDEEYADLSPQDGVYSAGNGIYNGLLCSDASEATGDCSKKPVYVRDSGVLVMAASVPYIRIQNRAGDFDTGSIDLRGDNTQQDFRVYLAGIYNNAPPSGSTVVISTENGEISGTKDWVIGGGTGPYSFDFTMIQEESPNKKISGKLSIVITTPGGNGIAGTKTAYTMDVLDDAPDETAP